MKKGVLIATLLTSFPVFADVFMLPETANILYDSDYPLNEYLISTQDKKCVFHYLSKNAPAGTNKIIVKNATYSDKCLKKGNATVQIINAQNATLETFSGFFVDGFFVGNLPLNSYIIKRTSDENEIQYLNFFIDEDKQLNIRYLGTMHSSLNNGKYGTFNACNPFEIILQTPNKALFQNEETLKNLTTVIQSYAKTICPSEKNINITASESPSLAKTGIFFKQQITFDDKSGQWIIKTFSAPEKFVKTILKEKPNETIANASNILETAQETGTAEKGTFVVHISKKTNEKVVYADAPFIMKALKNKHHLKEGWYEIIGYIQPMDDFERKKSGISLNETAALFEIESAKPCTTALCRD